MVEEYESEVSRLRAECTEAYHGIDLEKEKQQQVAEDMRTLFLQHMTTINMQAMTLFHPGSNVGVAPPVQQSTGEGSPTILRSSSGSLSPMPRSTSPMSLMTMKEEIGGGGSSASVPSTPYMNQSQDLSFQQSVGGGYPQHRAFVSPAVTKTQELLHETPVSSNNGSKGHYDKLQDMYKTSISSSNKFVNTSSNVAAHNRPSYAGSTRTAVGAPAATANTNKRVPGSASQPPGSAARTYGNTPGSARAPGKWN